MEETARQGERQKGTTNTHNLCAHNSWLEHSEAKMEAIKKGAGAVHSGGVASSLKTSEYKLDARLAGAQESNQRTNNILTT